MLELQLSTKTYLALWIWALTLGIIFLYPAGAQQRYEASGLVVDVNPSKKVMVVSCQEIHGFMEAMVMPFTVPDGKSLDKLRRGTLIDFTLIVDQNSSLAENIRIRRYASPDREPAAARRLQSLDEALRGPVPRLAVGQTVPDFTLTDQKNRTVHLSQFRGKVIALNFIYTRCALPEYCLRSSNNFGVLQRQYLKSLGRDLMLLTITFDPIHDQPELLARYAQNWKADSENWRFLTGSPAEIQRICDLFGVNFVPEEGLFIHSLHTAIIDRSGRLVTNLEGNEFAAQQLSDLVKAVLDSPKAE